MIGLLSQAACVRQRNRSNLKVRIRVHIYAGTIATSCLLQAK